MVQREKEPMTKPLLLCPARKVLLWPLLGHIGRLFTCHTDCPSLAQNGKKKGGSVERTHGFLQVGCTVGGGGQVLLRFLQISLVPCLRPPVRHADLELLGSPPPMWRGFFLPVPY